MKRGSFLMGFLTCLLLAGVTTTAYAAGIMAERSQHRILVDGTEVQMEAYTIGGNNYVKLRDIGEKVGFNVYWDSVNHCVQVESGKPYTGEAPQQAVSKAASADGSRYIPKVGDVIRCSDGTDYTIEDVSRWDKNAFSSSPLGELPTPTCDWSKLPQPELPEAEARHFNIGGLDYLFQRNLYETRRMLYTLYNAIGDNPETWQNGAPVKFPTTGHLLIEQGYDVKVFNLIDPGQSDCYNPFRYLRDEKDVLKLIDNLIKNTTPRNASSNDPFWEKAEIALDSALMLYLMSEAPPEEQNFETMLFMMEYAEVREEDEGYRSPLDLLFQALEEEQPNHVAVKQYKVFKQAAGKTAKSILISAAVRLAAFNIPQYAAMTARDDMDFGSLGERKRAIFCVIPINDASMNYLIGMLYTQCFQELYYRADEKYNGRLPVPVRVIQDEWANVAQPDSYPKILATCRSYNIGLNIIVQNIQNIKALYEKEWEGIIGNCDTLLFLGGGNEPTSLEFISKLLGKETLDTRTRGQTRGRNGSSSTNYQQAGRELMMIDEIRMMDTNDAILLIRGEKPVLDQKYDITRHPNFKKSAAGGAKPYVHKPQEAPDYALPDLPYEFHALDDYEFIDMEDSQNEQEE